ncbi:MAG TPA: MFS transporter [Ktedonobacteraceae bacterium]|nr:MFS transporter [Ktedonobacteraceae bacterium]
MRERREAERTTAEVSHCYYEIDVGNDHFLCLPLEVLTPPWSSKRFPCLDAQEMHVARNPGVVMAIWSLYMLDRGASLPLIGLSYTTFAIPIIFTAPLSGRLSDRYGRYWLFLSGMLLTGVIFCLYSLPSVTAWPIIFISIAEGIVTSVARTSLDGLLADIIPPDARGKVQANYTAAGLIGNLIGATTAGLLYGYSTGLPFLIEGILCFATALLLLLPGIARALFTARTNLQTERLEQELIEETIVEI